MFGYHGRSRRRQVKQARDVALGGLAAFGLGMLAMYLFDPAEGNRRRAVIRDKVKSLFGRTQSRVRGQAIRVRDRARGLLSETKARFEHDDANDRTLTARVRSALGKYVSNPGAIRVTAKEGVITLEGQVLSQERDDVVCAIEKVRGVEVVNDRLETSAHPSSSSLHGGTQGAF